MQFMSRVFSRLQSWVVRFHVSEPYIIAKETSTFIIVVSISSRPTYFAGIFVSTDVPVSAMPLVQCDAPYMSSVTEKLGDMKLQNERMEAQVNKMDVILRGLSTGESLTYTYSLSF